MNIHTITLAGKKILLLTRFSDFWELAKPRIAALVLVAVVAAGVVATGSYPDPLVLLHVVLGTALIATSASTFNQIFERKSDALMERTQERPLPAGRLQLPETILFGLITLACGTVYLLWFTGGMTTMWALLSWFLYVVCYTPLKTRSAWNTFVGAIAGAMPILIGWSAISSEYNLSLLGLFLILFFWQFPHFMAIAWIYKQEYAKAGLQMLPVVEPTGRKAGIHAIGYAVALLSCQSVSFDSFSQ